MKKTILTIIALLCFHLGFSQIAKIGLEMQVNTTAAKPQQNPAIAMDASGNYVIVWESLRQDGSGFGIYAQRFNSMGAAVGTETLINATTNDDQRFPAVSMDNSGNYTIVWQSINQDGDGWGVYMRRYSNAGIALSGEVLVNSTTAGQQRFPDIAMDDDGDYAVVWESEFDIAFQRFNASGVAQGSETTVNSNTAMIQNQPTIAMDRDGDFVIAWQSLGQDSDGYGVYAKAFNADGSVLANEFLANNTTANDQLRPDVAMDSNGNFAITWVSNLQDGSQEGIYARQFSNTGSPSAVEFLVNTNTTGAQDHPNISMTTSGEFIILWNDYGLDGSRFGVYYKQFAASGGAVSTETLVNTTTNNFQQFAAVSLFSSTLATIVWQDGDRNTSTSLDNDDYAIVQQRYDAITVPVELLYFTATAMENDQALLEWETSSESNNKGFYLERSQYGDAWETIDFVEGAGNSVENNTYQSVDDQPLDGYNYYRLKQVDFNGEFEYSVVRVLNFGESSFTIAPNPVQDVLNYAYEHMHELRSIQIYNRLGQLVSEINTFNGQINVKSLSAGFYILVVDSFSKHFEIRMVKK